MGAPLPALSRRPALVVLAALFLERFSYEISWQLGCWIGTDRASSGLDLARNAIAGPLLARSPLVLSIWTIALGLGTIWLLTGARPRAALQRTELLVDPRRAWVVVSGATLVAGCIGWLLFAVGVAVLDPDTRLELPVPGAMEFVWAIGVWFQVGVVFGELRRSAHWRAWHAIVLVLGIELARAGQVLLFFDPGHAALASFILQNAVFLLVAFVFASRWRDGLWMSLAFAFLAPVLVTWTLARYPHEVGEPTLLSELGWTGLQGHLVLLALGIAFLLRSIVSTTKPA